MKRALLVLVCLAGCHPWDDALNKRLAELDAGATLDGGDDGGSPTPDGGVDAGSDAGVDAGCLEAYCVVDQWAGLDAVNGVVMTSLADVAVVGDIGGNSFTARTRATPLPDGGQWRLVSTAIGVASGAWFTGVSADDVWAWHAAQLAHQEGDVVTDHIESSPSCGFEASFWYDGVAVSADEAWFAGSKFAVCHWTRDAGFQPATPTANFSVVDRDVTAIGVEPDGQVLLAAGPAFYRLDGGVAAAFPPGILTPQKLRWSPSGALWVLDSTQKVAHRPPAAPWTVDSVGAAGNFLYTLAVRADNDVWVGGDFTLVHFTGTGFENVLLNGFPGLPNVAYVYAVATSGPNDLVVAGFGSLNPNPGYGFVTRYTRH